MHTKFIRNGRALGLLTKRAELRHLDVDQITTGFTKGLVISEGPVARPTFCETREHWRPQTRAAHVNPPPPDISPASRRRSLSLSLLPNGWRRKRRRLSLSLSKKGQISIQSMRGRVQGHVDLSLCHPCGRHRKTMFDAYNLLSCYALESLIMCACSAGRHASIVCCIRCMHICKIPCPLARLLTSCAAQRR